MLLVHQAIRRLMHQAALAVDVDPDRAVVHQIPADRPPPGHHHRPGGLSP
jgi:hypothetical protein